MIMSKSQFKVLCLFGILIFPNFQDSTLFYFKFFLGFSYVFVFGSIKKSDLFIITLMVSQAVLHEFALGDFKSIKFSLVVIILLFRFKLAPRDIHLLCDLILLTFFVTSFLWYFSPDLYYLLYGNSTISSINYFTGPFVNHIEAGLAILFCLTANPKFIRGLIALAISSVVRSKSLFGVSFLYFLFTRSNLLKVFLIVFAGFALFNLYSEYENQINFYLNVLSSSSTTNRIGNYYSLGTLVNESSFVELLFGVGIQDLGSDFYAEVEFIRFLHLYGLIGFLYIFYILSHLPILNITLILVTLFLSVGVLPSPVSAIFFVLIIFYSPYKSSVAR